MPRNSVYSALANKMGRTIHIAEISSIEEAQMVLDVAQRIREDHDMRARPVKFMVGDVVDFDYSDEYGGGPWQVTKVEKNFNANEYTITNGKNTLENVCEYRIHTHFFVEDYY